MSSYAQCLRNVCQTCAKATTINIKLATSGGSSGGGTPTARSIIHPSPSHTGGAHNKPILFNTKVVFAVPFLLTERRRRTPNHPSNERTNVRVRLDIDKSKLFDVITMCVCVCVCVSDPPTRPGNSVVFFVGYDTN